MLSFPLRRAAACALAVLGLSASVHARDFGVQGNVWDIVEVDIRQMLVESASRVDWEGVGKEVQESAKTYVDRLPKRSLPIVEKTSTLWVDPSIVLTSDIQVPVEQPDGSLRWQLLHAKGTKVNPLESVRPTTAFFFFDGSDERQVELLKEVLKREPNRIVPVEAGAGSIRKTNELLGRPIFHGQDAMMNRFQVRYLPSLVYAGYGQYQNYLGVTSFGLPFSSTEVITAWPELGIKSGSRTMGAEK